MNRPHRSPALRAPPDLPSADPAVVLHAPRRLIGDLLTTWLTRTGFRVVGRADDFTALSELCGRCHPDLAIIDVGTNVSAMVRSLGDLRAAWHRVRIVVLHDELPPSELAEAQQSRLATLIPFSVRLESLFLMLNRRAGAAVTDPGGHTGAQDLTPQERETLNLVSTGHSVQQIAALLNISLSAVEGSKRRIYAKLRVASQSQAVARAVELGLVDALEPSGQPAADRNHPPDLTARELEVLRSIARGDTVRQTARLLTIAEKTVESLKARLFLKLDTHNRAGAIRAAYALGLLDDHHPPDQPTGSNGRLEMRRGDPGMHSA